MSLDYFRRYQPGDNLSDTAVMRILGDYEPTEPRVFHAEPTEVPMRECPSCKRRIPKSVVLCPNCQRYLTH